MADSHFFTNHGPFTLRQLAQHCAAELQRGNGDQEISDVAALHQAGREHLSFLDNRKYIPQFMESRAGACLLHPNQLDKAPAGMALLVTPQPYVAYAKAAALFYPDSLRPHFFHPHTQQGWPICETAFIGSDCQIAPDAVIASRASIGNGVRIGPGCLIGPGVVIGDGSVIAAHSVITHAKLGQRVLLHPGVKIGQDGFGVAPAAGGHVKVPQLGRVLIGDDVEIGAGSCIDRGAGPDTVIGTGTKIDNLVQVGHNVDIGAHCLIAAQTAFAGSCRIGNYVVIGGQVAIAGHLTIGDGVQIAGQSGVVADVPPKSTIGGTPAVPIRQWHRQSLALAAMVGGKAKAE